MLKNDITKINPPNHDLVALLLSRIEEEMLAMQLDTLLDDEEYAEFRAASFREAWEDFAEAELSVGTR